MYENLQRLTPFRFVAASMVVLFHFGRNVPPFNGGWMNAVAMNGNIAVSFFYCLSGFIMATVYRTEMDRIARAEYWLARLARIYPVYLLCLIASLFWSWHLTATQFFLSAFLLQSWVPRYPLTLNSPGWSLSVEFFFYLLFPFMIGALTRRHLLKSIIAAFALWGGTQLLSFYLRAFHYHGYPSASHDLLFYFPPMHVSEFFLGAIAGASYRLTTGSRFTVNIAIAAVSLTSVMGIELCARLMGLAPFAENGLYAPFFLAAIWIVASLPRVPLLEHPFAIMLGEASYAMYLLQSPLMSWFDSHVRTVYPFSAAEYFSCYVAVLIVLSLVIYGFFEKPMRAAIRKTFTGRPTAAGNT